MTFSILGRCEDTNMFGVAISSSSISVASRCPWVRSNIGAASTQNITDPSPHRIRNAIVTSLLSSVVVVE